MLKVDTLSALLFSTKQGNQLLSQLNAQLNSLIQNDRALLGESSTLPQIWECKWLNDPSVDGYSKGQAVWINTQTPQQILNSRYDQVLQYVEQNSILNAMYSRIDKGDQTKVNAFLTSVIDGTASKSVPPLYYLGKLAYPIQIKVSLKNNNKLLPSNPLGWYDFYKRSTMASNKINMMSCLSGVISSSFEQHRQDYHLSSLTDEQLQQMGFVKHDNFQISSVQTQHFYDHIYCEHMSGFDYVTNWKIVDQTWCREWKSGYVEQGGYVENTGLSLLPVSFIVDYNYLIGQKFYQDNYTKLNVGNRLTNIYGSIASGNRYVFTVTPILKSSAESAYFNRPIDVDGSKIYACVDATNFTNAGFSIVNIDTSKSLYSKYSWHVSGYKIT